MLSATNLAEALYQTDDMGLPTDRTNRFGEGRYYRSLWSMPYRTVTGSFFQSPYMWGYGGNFVVLLPKGISAFRFADGNQYDVEAMVLVGEYRRSFPAPSRPGQPLRERRSLSASELHAEFPGNTFYAGPLNMFPAADGVLYGRAKDNIDVGTWCITPDDHFYYTWHAWDGRRERCAIVYREAETFELYAKDRFGKEVYRRVPGNPEGY